MSRKHILDAIDASLKRLKTDYVDLYQLHSYDPATPIDEALEALDAVVRAGKARYVGVSNWPAYQGGPGARPLGAEGPGARSTSVQPRYNLLFRTFERDLLPLCGEEGIGVIPYNPLAGGLLTGKHDRGRAARGHALHARQRRRALPGALLARRASSRPSRRCKGVAAEAGMSMATMAVSWVLANPAITAPIVGASQPEQLADSLAAAETPLAADLKARLDELTHEWRAVDAER